ncbi:MAG: hypothetical protein JWL77_2298 [Chthonomonadaceae bacterium]|nr:hypothetical protein [Chthonomonadaceae bacterium]
MATTTTVQELKTFLETPRPESQNGHTAVSLFSGAGLSDTGYELAGFRFIVQAELEPFRSHLGKFNFPHSHWVVGDIRNKAKEIVAAYKQATPRTLDLLVATPPCQGMSTSNPSRGKRQTPEAALLEAKNGLILAIVPVVRELNPRLIVSENVRQILTLEVARDGKHKRVIDILQQELPEYQFFFGVVNIADYGIPQDRRRSVTVGIRRDEPWLQSLVCARRQPWPAPGHTEEPSQNQLPWNTVRQWFEYMNYEVLDAENKARAKGDHPLHFVPVYDMDRYLLVRDIPPFSGQSAYENVKCPDCGQDPVVKGLAICPTCGHAMTNRPIVIEDGVARLIKGFLSSYRRMAPDLPAPTVTTNSSHIGSDFKIHPWEHRVLSILEATDLQTVPRWYDWSYALKTRHQYTIRQVTGEAFPPYFTYQHGRVLDRLLSCLETNYDELAPVAGPGLGHRKAKKKPTITSVAP